LTTVFRKLFKLLTIFTCVQTAYLQNFVSSQKVYISHDWKKNKTGNFTQYMYMDAVEPVLRGHLCNKEKVVF